MSTATAGPRLDNLPIALSTFIGRERESAEVQRALSVHRILTLTAREREVVALIAQAKSNREIAAAMVVGVKTVETYVTRILNKLGFDSRVQIAMWAKDKGLA